MADAAVKASLRRAATERVLALPAGLRQRYDDMICALVRELSEYRGARQVLLYRALRDEVSLELLAAGAQSDGKGTFLPCVEADGALSYRSWRPGDPLRRSPNGVQEPVGGDAPAAVPTVALIPGRAFDATGARVGRGMGCFDRALDRLTELGPSVGIAYSCQLVEAVPCEPHDRGVGLVVTEKGIAAHERGGQQGLDEPTR